MIELSSNIKTWALSLLNLKYKLVPLHSKKIRNPKIFEIMEEEFGFYEADYSSSGSKKYHEYLM